MADLGIAGDSVSASSRSGAWAAGQGYAALLADRHGYTEVNVAVSGNTSAQISAQWTTLLARSPLPDLVLYMPGENDIPATSLASFRATVDADVARAVAAGVRVIIQTPWIYDAAYLLAAPPYIQALREIGAKYRVPVVDVFDAILEVKATDNTTFNSLHNPDGHPTVAGHAFIAGLYDRAQNKALMWKPYDASTGGGTPDPFSVWSATDKSAGMTVSADGRMASCTAADLGVRSTGAVGAGVGYAEVTMISGAAQCIVGVGKATAPMSYPGRGAAGQGYGILGYNGNKITADAHVPFGTGISNGQGFKIFYDADAGKLWLGKIGLAWPAGGDPEAGTNPAFSGLYGTFFVMFGSANPLTFQARINAGQNAFIDTPPRSATGWPNV